MGADSAAGVLAVGDGVVLFGVEGVTAALSAVGAGVLAELPPPPPPPPVERVGPQGSVVVVTVLLEKEVSN